MNAKEFEQLLEKLNACNQAREWCADKSLDEAWDQANNSDWMLWLLYNQKNKVTDRQLRLIAVKCARQVQHLMKDPRSIAAIDVAERFANGEATEEERDAARDAAWAAAGDAARDAAWAAAGAAARAAALDAARDAARAAARAAARDAWDAALDAARAAAGAAALDAARDAWDAALDAQCKIIREFIPKFEIE